jgi:hypothetical protein
MKLKAALVLFGIGLVLAARPVVAHHAFSAEFDASKPIKLTGSVTKFDWTNPHAWIFIDAKDDTGKVQNWGFELGGASGLMRNGWTRFSLKPGDVVTIEGTRAKNGSNNANAASVVTSSGQRLFSGENQGQQQ